MRGRDLTSVFLWITYTFLALVWLSVVRDPAFRQEGRLIPFTVLLAVHGYLHGSIRRWRSRLKAPVYFTAQAVLVGALVLLDGGKLLPAALFIPLLAEAAGLFLQHKRRKSMQRRSLM